MVGDLVRLNRTPSTEYVHPSNVKYVESDLQRNEILKVGGVWAHEYDKSKQYVATTPALSFAYPVECFELVFSI